ncbi:MAG: hypothetical protein JW854_15335 [Actinobacteria bacterium]|nr:hypothetical protein [Actinomycetota bacterium]
MSEHKGAKEVSAPTLPLRKRIKWDVVALAVSAVALYGLSLIFQDKGERALEASWAFFKEMAFVLPALMILMGLFAVWVDRRIVVRFLGKGSGTGGLFLAIILGALPTGPLYIAFPLAAILLKKGARVANVILFLSAWACIKLPQELMELQFLGWEFMLLRLGLTVAVLIPMALLAEFLYHRGEGEGVEPFEWDEVEGAGSDLELQTAGPAASDKGDR